MNMMKIMKIINEHELNEIRRSVVRSDFKSCLEEQSGEFLQIPPSMLFDLFIPRAASGYWSQVCSPYWPATWCRIGSPASGILHPGR